MSSGVSTQAGVEIAQLAGEAGFIAGTAFTMIGITLVVSPPLLPLHFFHHSRSSAYGIIYGDTGPCPRIRAPARGVARRGGQALSCNTQTTILISFECSSAWRTG